MTRPRIRWPRALKPAARWRFSPWLGMTERRRSAWRRLTPPQLFVASFVLLVVLGTLGLRTLPGLYTGERLGWIDALFTATSAVCITGLVVVDTATHFTFAGQLFLLVLIQLGGLGMITFTTLIILAIGRRLSLRHERLNATGAEVAPQVPLDRLTKDVLRFTIGIELVGALGLYVLWIPRFGWREAAWPAVFQSINAFCNAGFSTFSDSLVGLQRSPAALMVIAILVLAGGIGFLTMEELALQWRAWRSRSGFRLSLHSRLAIATSAILLVGAWPLFALFEWHNTLAGLGTGERLANALFMSVTPRSSGFNSVDYAATTESTNFLSIILMFIGGSPGSTAGGIKTTTLALIALVALERFRGGEMASIWGRSVPEQTVQRAIGLAVVAFTVVTASIFALTWTEAGTLGGGAGAAGSARFLAHMFEAVSAFNTVGLSMGLTPTLSDGGKSLLALLMLVGRVGPLTFAAALVIASDRRHEAPWRYAYEDVVVG